MAKSRGKWLGFSLIIIGTLFLLDSTGTFDIGDLIEFSHEHRSHIKGLYLLPLTET